MTSGAYLLQNILTIATLHYVASSNNKQSTKKFAVKEQKNELFEGLFCLEN